jgi:hypothetical protein
MYDDGMLDQPIRSYVDHRTKQIINMLNRQEGFNSEAATIRYLIRRGLESLENREIFVGIVEE